MRRRELLLLGGVAVAAASAGVWIGPRLMVGRGDAAPLLAASFPDPSGKPRAIAEWRGRTLVCNFWASWCLPCVEEMPMFSMVRDRNTANGVEFIGIAVEKAAKVVEFQNTVKVSYPLLVADAAGLDLMRALGNKAGGLPFTVFLDRNGRLTGSRLGAMKEPELLAELRRSAGADGHKIV